MVVRDGRADVSIANYPDRPDANALKTGSSEEFLPNSEDIMAIKTREWEFYHALKPQNFLHSWMLQQATITSLRIERSSRVERRLRDQISAKSEFFWEDEQRLEAEVLGGKLADDPIATVNKLQRTPQGCEWMMKRWSLLARAFEQHQQWTKAQRSMAFDLLGEPADARFGDPGEVIDLDGRLVEAAPDPVTLARAQVKILTVQRDRVTPFDQVDRSLAANDLAERPHPELAALRRHETTLVKRLKWYLDQTSFVSKFPRPHHSVAPSDLEALQAPPAGTEPEELVLVSEPLDELIDLVGPPNETVFERDKRVARAAAQSQKKTKKYLRKQRRA